MTSAKNEGRPTRRDGGRELVNGTAIARHLCFERAYLDKLLDAGVLERDSNGKFDLDDSRRRYITYLREERKRSPRSEADADFQRARSELIRLRIAEKQRRLIDADEAYAMIDEMAGLFLTRLSGFAARCGGRDLAARRAIDQAVFDLRLEVSQAATKLADQRGEPALDEVTTPR
jgi:hypothetical protein